MGITCKSVYHMWINDSHAKTCKSCFFTFLHVLHMCLIFWLKCFNENHIKTCHNWTFSRMIHMWHTCLKCEPCALKGNHGKHLSHVKTNESFESWYKFSHVNPMILDETHVPQMYFTCYELESHVKTWKFLKVLSSRKCLHFNMWFIIDLVNFKSRDSHVI